MRNKQVLVFSFPGILWILYLGLRAFFTIEEGQIDLFRVKESGLE